MDLPNLLSKFNKQPESIRQFLAVEISPTVVKSAVWQVRREHTEIVSIGSVQSFDNQGDDEQLITAVDTSLADSLAGIENEPDEVIFGLPETWVSGNVIAPQHKPILKEMCKKLGLKPVGFVVTTEALINFLNDTEGSPPSAILINLSGSEIAVSLVYLGKLEGTQVVGRSENISSDVEEGIARFPKSDNLPSRMILYDGREDLEGIKQELIAVDWQAKLPFLHFPKIESLARDFTIQAVALSGGQEVAQSLGLEAKAPDHVPVLSVADSEFSRTDSSDKAKTSPPELLEPEMDAQEIRSGSESETQLTHTPDIQPAIEHVPTSEHKLESDELIAPNLAAEFGFTTKKSSTPPSPQSPTTPFKLPSTKPLSQEIDTDQPALASDNQSSTSSAKTNKPFRLPSIAVPSFSLMHLSRYFGKYLPKFKTHRSSTRKLNRVTIIAIALGLLLFLIVGGTMAYWYLPNASLVITLKPQPITKEITFFLDPDIGTMNVPSKTIPATVQTLTQSDSRSYPATGTKTVGEPAKGTVTVYNRTSSSRTFAQGTQIRFQNLTFTLDREVRVASASTTENADFSLTVVPSSADVPVTASAIGEASNLPTNTQFTIANFSTDTYIAQNKAALSGGFAREVAVVSNQDIQDARLDVINTLQTRVSAAAQEQAGPLVGIVVAGEPEIDETNADPGVNTETETFNYSATVSLTLYSYQKNDLTVLGQELLKDQIPPNFKLLPEATSLEVSDSSAEQDSQTASVTATINLLLLPNINPNEIVSRIRGKQVVLVQDYLKTLPNFDNASVTVTPAFPGPLYTYPQRAERISVTIEPGDVKL